MEQISQLLFSYRDEAYAAFTAKLTPSVAPASVIGVRMPILRRLAKELAPTPEAAAFLDELPHAYYEENMLHVLLVDLMFRQYDAAIARTEAFLPFLDNWAVCDSFRPRAFRADRPALRERVAAWLHSSHVYTVRFGAVMVMRHFLEKDFSPALLETAARIYSDEYYINMALAWLLCEALIKQYDAAVPLLESGAVNRWVHNKAIQKSVESYRLSDETKAYLRTLRR